MERPKCEACEYWEMRGRGEAEAERFEWLFGLWVFDIDQAKAILAASPREPVAVDLTEAGHPVHRGRLEEGHLAHVDPAAPGILATVRLSAPDRSPPGSVLIDGHHRQARALAEKLPFFAYLLTEEETRRVLVRRPEDAAREARARRAAAPRPKRGAAR